MSTDITFDVALSFAGEDRAYVEEVAKTLRLMDIRVFYDKYETASLWGKNLYEHLQDIYFAKSRFVVLFLSENYAKKLWTNHERRSAQAKAFESHEEYILPARFDNTEIPGILPTIGYIDLREYSPQELAKLIKEKIGPIRRFEYLPNDLDLLYELLSPKSEQEESDIDMFASALFESLKLMTFQEKSLLFTLVENTCAAGPPENAHMNIELLSRFSKIPIEEIKAIFARLDCLGFSTNVYEKDNLKDNLCKSKNIIELQFRPLLADTETENGTFILFAVAEIVSTRLCPECRKIALDTLDFSILSTLTGFPE